jgi:hypothetical protein
MSDLGTYQAAIAIGGMPIGLRCERQDFIRMLERRYEGFVVAPGNADIQLDIDIVEGPEVIADEDLQVSCASGRWTMTRGDFRAEWDPAAQRGRVRQEFFPYAIDAVLRIVHSLVLAESGGGFLLHSASAIRNGRAFLFSGVSGAGKTTISRLAPADATLLSDEISYVRLLGERYYAFGTPFAGDLGISGENVKAPLHTIYFLKKGDRNRIKPISPADAAGTLLRNVLFFADDESLVRRVFQTACEFVSRIPVFELTFRPDEEVWTLIK